jgi:hypothetical protein
VPINEFCLQIQDFTTSQINWVFLKQIYRQCDEPFITVRFMTVSFVETFAEAELFSSSHKAFVSLRRATKEKNGVSQRLVEKEPRI